MFNNSIRIDILFHFILLIFIETDQKKETSYGEGEGRWRKSKHKKMLASENVQKKKQSCTANGVKQNSCNKPRYYFPAFKRKKEVYADDFTPPPPPPPMETAMEEKNKFMRANPQPAPIVF